jgi:carboxyl-terminal processing protease
MKRYSAFVAVVMSVLIVGTSHSFAAKKDDTYELLELFGDVFEKVKRDYVEEVDNKDLIEAAINGMLSSLDPHSSYLNAKAFTEMRVQTKGEFGGLGIEVTMENGLVKVVSPIDDTPAFRAGIKAGDYISRIDGEAVMGSTLSESVEKMRGKPGTKIRLEVLREGESEPLEITIKRAIIEIKSVRAKSISNDIGYVRITSFSEQTAVDLKRHVKRILKEQGKNFRGLILDLRNNPGGLLDQAIEVSDLFLEKGEIVSTHGRVEGSAHRFNAKSGDIIGGKPVIILINGGSASASEIVSGALQDHKRALIVGTKSFGKGSVQTVVPLNTGSGAMRLTTSRYFTPSGRSIQAEGIDPDIVVESVKIEDEGKKRELPSESTLRRHLKSSKKKDSDGKVDHVQEQRELYAEDYQLGRAVDLLRAVSTYK